MSKTRSPRPGLRSLAISALTMLLFACTSLPAPTAGSTAGPTATPQPVTTQPSATSSPSVTPSPTANAVPPVIHITDLQMIDDQTGWAVFAHQVSNDGQTLDDQAYLARTTDGGHTWANVTPPEAGAIVSAGMAGLSGLRLSALDAEHAWAIPVLIPYPDDCIQPYGYWPIAWRTSDGGLTWHISSPVAINTLPRNIQAIDDQHAFLNAWIYEGDTMAGACIGETFRTEDGGTSWQRIYQGTYYMDPMPPTFFDANHGLIKLDSGWADLTDPASRNYITPNWLRQTADGGDSWQWMLMPSPPPSIVQSTWGDPSMRNDWGFTDTFVQLSPQVLSFQVNYTTRGTQATIHAYHISSDYFSTYKSLWQVGDTFFASDKVGWRLADPATFALEQTEDGGVTWLSYPQPPQESWTIQTPGTAATILHTTERGATTAEIQPTFNPEPLWPGRGLRLESISMENNLTGWAVEAGGATLCTADGAIRWNRCPAPATAALPPQLSLPDFDVHWSPGEPLPQELLFFTGGSVPDKLLSEMRRSIDVIAKSEKGWRYIPDDPSASLDEQIRSIVKQQQEDLEQKKLDLYGYHCGPVNRVDWMTPGQIGLPGLCSVGYIGEYLANCSAGCMNPGGYADYYWQHYYYVFVQNGESTTWPNVTSADFITGQTGWRQLDRQNGSYRIQKTTDGGETWQDISTVYWLAELDFVNDQEGWAIARQPPEQYYQSRPDPLRDALLMHTIDGGRTWEIVLPVVGP
jgi:photosystem II stability/assembly factor-like uncharacterized protein